MVRERSLLSRFAVSRPTQATEVDDLTVSILRVHDGHTGSADTNATTDEALRDVAARAGAAARAAADAAGAPGDYPGLPAPAPARPHDGFDPDTARLDPAGAGSALRTAFERCAAAGLQAFGIWTAGAVDTAIASSTGVRATDALTDAYMKVIARHESGRSGWAAGAGTAIAALDPEALAARAAAKVSREEPMDLAPGEYPVVLEHDAVGSLLDFLGGLAFNGLAHTEGRGALVGRLGQRVAAAERQPGRLAALRAHAAARDRRRGRAQAPAAPHPGRRRPRGRPRHALGRARGHRVHGPRAGPGRLGLRAGARPTSCSPAAARPTRPSSWPRSSAACT